jgi:hypothetical protein
MMTELTELEFKCLSALADVWEYYLQLPELHPDDLNEFRLTIHTAQNIILARPTMRTLAEG